MGGAGSLVGGALAWMLMGGVEDGSLVGGALAWMLVGGALYIAADGWSWS